jgi:transposase
MDELAIRKGHRYATVVVELRRKEVRRVGRGQRREDVRPFFELLGEDGRRRLRAVAMDMNGAYEQEVRAQCPHAAIVYDLFHVVAEYGRQVIDRVRVNEANRLKNDGEARRVVKSARRLLLRNEESIGREEDRVRLAELPAANRTLAKVYLLKDDLKHLWDYRHAGYAREFWDHWYSRAVRSRIEPLKALARNLKSYLPGIPARCRRRLHTSLPRRNQQQDQGAQAHGLRKPRRRLLFPQDTPGIPRCWDMDRSYHNHRPERRTAGQRPHSSHSWCSISMAASVMIWPAAGQCFWLRVGKAP